MTENPKKSLRAIEVRFEVPIAAPRERVWKAFTHDLAAWWPRTFFVSPNAKTFALETRVGGRLYEDWGDGQGVLWATVVTLSTGELLQTSGDLFAEYGGPARVLTTFRFEVKGDTTILRFHLSVSGMVAEARSARSWRRGGAT